MILGLGTDIINIKRIAKSLEKFPEKFKNNYFTAAEIEDANIYSSEAKITAHFAKRFAAKEAFAKAVGTGFGEHLNHKDVGVINDEKGKPCITLTERADLLLQKLSDSREVKCHISLSDDEPYAQAVVILEVV